MGKKIVTLYIDDSGIRLLVTDSKRIKKWAYLPLEPELVDGATIVEEAKVAASIKQLLKDQKVRAGKVIVGLSGLHCITRPVLLPQLPKTLLEEAVMREAQRLLPLPIDQFYVSWQTLPSPLGKTQVFVAAMLRKSADAMLKTLRQAGLNPYLIDLKPLALSRLASESTAMIVDVQATEFDLIIMANGISQPIRTVTFPQDASSWQEKYQLIRNELARTIQFYNTNNQESPLVRSTSLFVSGDLAYNTELMSLLSSEFDYHIAPLAQPLDCPEQLDLSRYIVNIGLALKEPSLMKKGGPSAANLNLLPAPYRPKPISWGRAIAIPGAAVTVALLVPMVMLVDNISANISLLHSQLDTTNRLIAERQQQKKEIETAIIELEQKVAEAGLYRNAFAMALNSIKTQGNELNADLRVVTDAVPDNVSLTVTDYTDDILKINGIAPSEVEVLSYATSLNDSGQFAEITVASVRKNLNNETEFSLILKMRGQ